MYLEMPQLVYIYPFLLYGTHSQFTAGRRPPKFSCSNAPYWEKVHIETYLPVYQKFLTFIS